MRWLKKRDGDGTLWPWTPILAKRSDMIEVERVEEARPAEKIAAIPAAGAPDVYAITDKAELREIGRKLTPPVTFAGNPTLTSMQAKLAEALGVAPLTE